MVEGILCGGHEREAKAFAKAKSLAKRDVIHLQTGTFQNIDAAIAERSWRRHHRKRRCQTSASPFAGPTANSHLQCARGGRLLCWYSMDPTRIGLARSTSRFGMFRSNKVASRLQYSRARQEHLLATDGFFQRAGPTLQSQLRAVLP